VVVDNGPEAIAAPLRLPPPAGGTRIRIVDIPPDTPEFLARGAERMAAAFGEIGDVGASTVAADSPHPLMHRTETVDYGIVIEGELVLVLDTEERRLLPGDVVIQRGTNHAWANRSDRPCRIAFVLLDGRTLAGTTQALQRQGHMVLAVPTDVADAAQLQRLAVLLASRASAFITGQTLVADGGTLISDGS